MSSDNFCSAFCVFHAHFWEKMHSFKICALKKRNDFRQVKRSSFRVEKCKTEENLSKFLNSLAYKTVTSMRDCVMKRNILLCKTCTVFILMKCICFIIKINHVKNIALKNPLFSQKNALFSNMCTFLSHCFETKNYHCLCHNTLTRPM